MNRDIPSFQIEFPIFSKTLSFSKLWNLHTQTDLLLSFCFKGKIFNSYFLAAKLKISIYVLEKSERLRTTTGYNTRDWIWLFIYSFKHSLLNFQLLQYFWGYVELCEFTLQNLWTEFIFRGIFDSFLTVCSHLQTLKTAFSKVFALFKT